jgi:1-aminocyclopropane-1-carboxylate deaminase/D-cysteine desulfhydrase-like pyridoxal-dependent ACC family enzyme
MAIETVPTLARRRFALLPTPLEAAPSLGDALGLARPLYVKRDDLTGPGMGGNKVRKLEFLIADAESRGADCLVTFGAAQSNSARLSAVVGAMAGLEVHLVLGGKPGTWEGNLVLDRLAGARLHFVDSDEWNDLSGAMTELADELRSRGRRPYAVPMGGSTPIGALGYVEAFGELLEQLDRAGVEADWVVHASSTGGTQAGLIAGRVLHGRGPGVFGIDVIKGGPPLREEVHRLASEAVRLHGSDADVAAEDVRSADFTGGSYGAITESSVRAIRLGVRTAGIVADPIYSGKALAAIPELVGIGGLPGEGAIVFLLTGGQPALFSHPYASDLSEGG